MWMWVVGALRILFVILNNLYCIPVHLAWLLLLQPLRLVVPLLYWKIEGVFFRWLLSMVALWSYSAGYDIIELGDDVWQLAGDRTLVMYNHQSTSDVPLIMAAFNCRPPTFTASVMWIMDRVFRMTNFGVVSLMHGDFFIRAGAAYRDSSLHSLRQHLANFYQPRGRKWIVLFPEGGFLINRKPTSQKFGQKHGLPHLQHVSLPRCGALKAILEHSAQQQTDGIKWVVDVTVGYPDGDPLNLQTLLAGWRPACATVMHYRCYTADKIPLSENELNAWLYERYVEKERLLAEFYATGVFPDTPSPAYPAPAPLPPLTDAEPLQKASDSEEHSKQREESVVAKLRQCNHSTGSEALLSVAGKTPHLNAVVSFSQKRGDDSSASFSPVTQDLLSCNNQTVVLRGANSVDETSSSDLKGSEQMTCNVGISGAQRNATSLSVDRTIHAPSTERGSSDDLQSRLCGRAALSSVSFPSDNSYDSSSGERLEGTSNVSVRDLNLVNVLSKSASLECSSTQPCFLQQLQSETNTRYESILTNGDDRCVPDTVNNNSPKHSLSLQKPSLTDDSDSQSLHPENTDEPSNCNRRNGSTTSWSSSLRDSSFTAPLSTPTLPSSDTQPTTAAAVTTGSSRDAARNLYTETHRPYLGKLPGVVLRQDPLEFVLRHIFYLVSSYLAWSALSYACSSLLHLCC